MTTAAKPASPSRSGGLHARFTPANRLLAAKHTTQVCRVWCRQSLSGIMGEFQEAVVPEPAGGRSRTERLVSPDSCRPPLAGCRSRQPQSVVPDCAVQPSCPFVGKLVVGSAPQWPAVPHNAASTGSFTRTVRIEGSRHSTGRHALLAFALLSGSGRHRRSCRSTATSPLRIRRLKAPRAEQVEVVLTNCQVGWAGGSAVFPVLDVVAFGPLGRSVAAGEPAAPVLHDE